MTNFTPEMIEKAKTVASAEELLTLAKENGVELTAEEAKLHFDQLHPATGELSDDDLDNVAGGGCGDDGPTKWYNRFEKQTENVIVSGRMNCSVHIPGGCESLFRGKISFHTNDKLNSPWTMTCKYCKKSLNGTGDPYYLNGDRLVPGLEE